jgi:hypothetical protein
LDWWGCISDHVELKLMIIGSSDVLNSSYCPAHHTPGRKRDMKTYCHSCARGFKVIKGNQLNTPLSLLHLHVSVMSVVGFGFIGTDFNVLAYLEFLPSLPSPLPT